MPETLCSMLWAVPRSPTEYLRCHQYRRPIIPNRISRMVSFPFNHPTITAYSICWDMRTWAIHAHQPGEDLAFYTSDTVCKHAFWSYFPINPGEFVVEIWKRWRRLDRELALVFKTNQGRLYLLEPQQRECWGECHWTLINQPKPSAATISYNEGEYGIQQFVFETPGPTPNSLPPTLPQAPSPFPESTSLEDYFYSSAVLDDVAEVAICKTPGGERVTGLLLRYIGGREACVGSIRLDYLDLPVRVLGGESTKMWLEFICGSRGVFIRTVQFARPECSTGEEASQASWFEVSMCGLLEWWFSSYQSKLYYGGRASRATRL